MGRRLARRTAWHSVAAVAGGVFAELPRTAEIAAVQVLSRDSTSRNKVDATATKEARTAVAPTPAMQTPALPPTGRTPFAAGMDAQQSSAPSIRDTVFAFLNSQVGVEEYPDAGDDDDPYLQWLAAQALGIDVAAVAPHVREWSRWAADQRRLYRSGENGSGGEYFGPWTADMQPNIPTNHLARRP